MEAKGYTGIYFSFSLSWYMIALEGCFVYSIFNNMYAMILENKNIYWHPFAARLDDYYTVLAS
jgi:hypothetical protein